MNFHSMMEHYPLHGLMSPWQTLSFQKDHAFTVNLLAMETAESVKHFFHVDGKAKSSFILATFKEIYVTSQLNCVKTLINFKLKYVANLMLTFQFLCVKEWKVC